MRIKYYIVFIQSYPNHFFEYGYGLLRRMLSFTAIAKNFRQDFTTSCI